MCAKSGIFTQKHGMTMSGNSVSIRLMRQEELETIFKEVMDMFEIYMIVHVYHGENYNSTQVGGKVD